MLLLEYGVDIDYKNKRGRKALDTAKETQGCKWSVGGPGRIIKEQEIRIREERSHQKDRNKSDGLIENAKHNEE